MPLGPGAVGTGLNSRVTVDHGEALPISGADRNAARQTRAENEVHFLSGPIGKGEIKAGKALLTPGILSGNNSERFIEKASVRIAGSGCLARVDGLDGHLGNEMRAREGCGGPQVA